MVSTPILKSLWLFELLSRIRICFVPRLQASWWILNVFINLGMIWPHDLNINLIRLLKKGNWDELAFAKTSGTVTGTKLPNDWPAPLPSKKVWMKRILPLSLLLSSFSSLTADLLKRYSFLISIYYHFFYLALYRRRLTARAQLLEAWLALTSF